MKKPQKKIVEKHYKYINLSFLEYKSFDEIINFFLDLKQECTKSKPESTWFTRVEFEYCYPDLEIYERRMQTDQEYAVELRHWEKEEKKRKELVKQNKDREYKLYESLKKKFEKT